MNRHHYLVLLRLSAPSADNLDENEVERLVLGPGGDDVPHPLRVEDVDVSVTDTDQPEPEEPSLSAEDRNSGLAAAGE